MPQHSPAHPSSRVSPQPVANGRTQATRPSAPDEEGAHPNEPLPRLPHEHDESSDSQTSEPHPVMRQAKRDLDRGLVDTDRGVPMEQAYQQQKQPAAPRKARR